MGILISLIMAIISQCVHISKHHIHFKYIQFVFVKIKVKREELSLEGEMKPQTQFYFDFCFDSPAYNWYYILNLRIKNK